MNGHLPQDGFEDYFFHKLKSWVPENYWTQDFENGSLESLIRGFADSAARMRREIDRVWTASSIELADDWAVDYLGDLVGAEKLSAQNRRANRTTVANMMSYNQRKTTRYLLDQFIGDIFSTEGYVREIERWLLRPPHSLDMAFGRTAPLSRGPVAGLPNITTPRADDAALIAFDEFAHLPEFGPRRGRAASFDYATIHLNVFATESYRLDMAAPFWLDDTHLTLDPSGRDVPLFHSATFDHRLGEWPVGPEEFPTEMRCARFNASEFEVTEEGLDAIGSPPLTTTMAPWIGIRFTSLFDFRRVVVELLSAVDFGLFWGALLREMMVKDCAKVRQITDDLLLDIGPFADTRTLDNYRIVAANLAIWMPLGNWPELAGLLVDVGSGRVQFETAPDPDAADPEIFHPRFHHIGMVHRVGAGAFPRNSSVPIGPAVVNANIDVPFTPPAAGTETFGDNRRYVWQWDATRRHDVAGDLRFKAADQTRPYVLSQAEDGSLDFTIVGSAGQANTVVIDGLWLGVLANAAIETGLVNPDDPFPFARARLIFDGQFESVTLRHVTIDPGGEQVRLDPLIARAIPIITTEIEGSIRSLRIENSVLGPLVETQNVEPLFNAGTIRISDSIVVSIDPNDPAISFQMSSLYLENTTILGAVHANLIFATNTIFDGPLYVTNLQQSCLRFSAVAGYEAVTGILPSRLPRRFECVTYPETLPRTTFLSQRFGDPDFAGLSHLAEATFLTGGEYRTEMGVGNSRFWNQRREDLARFVAKFLPVGQHLQIYEQIGA
ncbi:hypothetical protein SAMN05216420_102311 [Nitrosospira sp. Nl5]|uniref:hypothetical protein n=1 Tax=Nitrosospira sp. Nl5 TaxID=200120 RepID=UPI00088AC34B|nr:hypothetical protein [Nitrosospira sp. Nl5]SCY10400.1 hypothetical protein SAMN05216420_102311 [Nitrosospira sp. Nl5]